MRREPTLHARIRRRLPDHHGQSRRRKAKHARSADPVLRLHRPTAGHVGLHEGDLRRQGVTARVAKLPMNAVLRVQASGAGPGFMKVLVGASDDRIRGFTMIGPEAGEVVSAVQVAMLAGLPYPKLRDAVLAHLTMAEGLGFLLS